MSTTINGTTGISAIPDDIVTTDKILDTAVTAAKLDSAVLADYQRISLEASQGAAGTYIQFTAIPAWAKRLTLMFQGVSLSGTDRPLVQFADGSGLVTSGYDTSSTYMTTASTYNFVSVNTTGFVINSPLAANVVTGIFTFTNVAGDTWVGSGTFKTNATTSAVASGDATGLGSALETVRITTTGTNTFDAGTFSLLVEG